MPTARVLGLAGAAAAAGSVAAAIAALASYRPDRRPGPPAERPTDFGELRDAAAGHLAELVRIPTVTDPGASDDDPAFARLRSTLATRFPLVHGRLELSRIAGNGLLYRLPGAGTADPLVLMAHLDVVPVETEPSWRHPAFGGVVDDGRLWGRGTLDDKGAVVAILTAVEGLLAGGNVPARDVYLSFGGNEESSGTSAAAAVDELAARGARPWLVIDEGGAVVTGAFPGVSAPIAVIGVTEKGIVDLELRVQGSGGHASTPPRNDAPVRLARALVRLDARPFPPSLPRPVHELVDRLGRHARLPLRAGFSVLRHFPGVLARTFALLGPETAAMIRTTLAFTQLAGSSGHNVLAPAATAMINMRVLPGETVDDCLERVRRVIDDDRVELRAVWRSEPSPVSPTSGPAWDHLTSTVEAVFPDAVATPYLVMAATDARAFTGIAECVYRFAPFRMSAAQRAAIHNVDEHIDVDALAEGVWWYRRLIENLPG